MNNQLINSDAGETTSTDSDIGTSPSGTTLASPPSSPQQLFQQQQQQQQYPNLSENLNISNTTNFKYINNNTSYDTSLNHKDIINSSPLSSQSSTTTLNNNNNNSLKSNNSRSSTNRNSSHNNNLNSSIVRQHSYLNAVQLNDYKQGHANQKNQHSNFSQTQNFKQQSKLSTSFKLKIEIES